MCFLSCIPWCCPVNGWDYHTSLTNLQRFPSSWDRAQAHIKAVWLQCLCGLELCSNPKTYLPKSVFQKEIKELGWEGGWKDPTVLCKGITSCSFNSSFVQQNKTLCIPCNFVDYITMIAHFFTGFFSPLQSSADSQTFTIWSNEKKHNAT